MCGDRAIYTDDSMRDKSMVLTRLLGGGVVSESVDDR
jgi:hypothetical protein